LPEGRKRVSIEDRCFAIYRRTGQVPVDRREGVELVFEQVLVLGVEVTAMTKSARRPPRRNIIDSRSDELATVNTDSGPLANDLGREHEVFQDLLVDGRQGARSGSLLAELALSGFLSEHSSLGDKDDVSVGELLFEFSGESGDG
jgi:hypothetical protein